jgi:iron-sulfur cluster assembly accessory protein
MQRQIIELSKSACSRLACIAKDSNTTSILFRIKGGGCNGLNYVFEPTNVEPDKLDEVIKRPGYQLVVCSSSLMHILGTRIDWKKDIMGETFHFDNPTAESQCGCGTSFSSKNM